MWTLKALLFTQLCCCLVSVFAENSYPRFTRSPVAPFSIPPNQSFTDVADQALAEVNTVIVERMGKKPSERIGSGIELQTWLRQNRKWATDQAAIFRARLDKHMWPTVTVAGRLPLPSVLANNGSGLVPGIDCMWSIHNLADNTESAVAIIQYGMFWQIVFESDPTLAVSWLHAKKSSSQVSTADVVELQSVLGYWPGGKLGIGISKQEWQALHQSANPLNRFIALEKFDSVEQSPAELLALYRECLLGACSYLEVRALEAITRNKDFREEVAKLLEEYIASNPPTNDGTLPSLRNNFPNLIDGAKRVIASIRNTDKPAVPTSPHVDPFAQTTPTPKPPPVVQPPAPKKTSELKAATISEEPAFTPWLVWGVLIVTGSGLLWLLHKRR